MTGIAIYMEGGGQKAAGKAALRVGMGGFLSPLRDLARNRGLGWKVVACGGRDEAYEAFKHAVRTEPDLICLLLVDAESEVIASGDEHVRERDGWEIPAPVAAGVHLMAQVMETWLVADVPALQRYYGQYFAANGLPRHADLEKVDKDRIFESLKTATERTQKGPYHKITHASKLLERIDAAAVRRRCTRCELLFRHVEDLLDEHWQP